MRIGFTRASAVAVVAALACAAAAGAMPDSGEVKLQGEYRHHLQDVCRDGEFLYWAHTSQLVKTDLSGKVVAKADVAGHHAGIEVRDGKVYVAVCVSQSKTGGKTLPDSRVTVSVYDAATLKLVKEHVTDVNDRSGSLAILDDGSFLVGCLRPPDIAKTQVRFHHLDKDFKLVKSYVLDNVPVKLGIETIKLHGGFCYLSMYLDGGLCLKLDREYKEVARYRLNGTYGMVFDGDKVWTAYTRQDPETKKWRSGLKLAAPPAGMFDSRGRLPPSASPDTIYCL